MKRCVKHCEIGEEDPACNRYTTASYGICSVCSHYPECHTDAALAKSPIETPWGWLFEGLDGVWYTVCMFQGKRFGQWEAFETVFDVGEDIQTCYEIKG